jgi:hypothetical protein
MLFWNWGIVPVMWILEGMVSSCGDDVEVEWFVAHIPKFAIDRYMYFAGVVNDKVGVTFIC